MLSRIFFVTSLLISGCILSACTSTQPAKTPVIIAKLPQPKPWMNSEHFGERPKIISPAEVSRLSIEQQSEFLAYFRSHEEQDTRANKVIGDYLKQHLSDFNYYSDTLTAQNSLIEQQGNCLSLAILTKALADLVNVEVKYQLVQTTPVYQKEGNVILSSQHVRTKLLDPKIAREKGEIVLLRGGVYIDYFPTLGSRALRSVDEAEFYSMYYRNKAAEALINKNNVLAYWLLRQSLSLKPSDAHAINMMAVVYSNTGQLDTAAELYRYGIENSENKLDLLSNYHTLLKKTGQIEEAAKIAKILDQYDDPNPFKWVRLANTAYNARNYSRAIYYYKKASRAAPYLHEPYAGIARSNFQMGRLTSAQQAMEKALQNTHKHNTKKLYQAKYEMLSQLLNKDSH
ncbi:tetratricopeptide repeat protein [Aliikangiella coralliicola]|uniref:Uncharacterized protein n=1 Tax=Aliikangiella coralliicola TaxID=2592383 RepID=A0A545UJM0_9GAMM|nr:hypothetical protein [Aliikangiella coralliicola]TQV89668.1 hypothetical protein FLL46_01940 [Aliikangiella coralliicola]